MTQDECMILFSDISEIQILRHKLMDAMAEQRKRFHSGKISRRKFHKTRLAWMETEAELRREVTRLYDIGYTHGCF